MTDAVGTGDDTGAARPAGLVALCAIAAVAGALIGFVGGAFRWCLVRVGDGMGELIERAHDLPGPGWLVPIAVAATGAALGRLLVVWVPLAAGSGIQHVEAVWRGEADLAPVRVLPAKFVGGILALGSGLVLGREGPTVQMGAVLGVETGRRARLSDSDLRVLQAAVAGAGLAVAFNAPLGGAIFVFEEVARSFRARLALVTLISCPVAVACSRLIIGNAADLPVPTLPTPPAATLVLIVVFGVLTGLLGAAYNRVIIAALDLTDRLAVRSPVALAALVGAVIGLLAYLDTDLVGEGTALTRQVLAGDVVLWSLVGYLVVRFALGPLSYSVGTAGGLFSPLLAIGAMWGALFHDVADWLLPGAGASATSFAVVGMAAFFTGVVRAPVTGIAIILEMTAGTTHLTTLLLAACFASTLAATQVRSEAIYDTLRTRMLRRMSAADRAR